MDSVHECFKKYKQSGFVKCNEKELMKRLKNVLNRLNYSYESPIVNLLSKSIQYPYQNGKFVILLDVCTLHDFLIYMNTSHIQDKYIQIINDFYKKIKKISQNNINIHNYKFKSFKHKKIKYTLNTIPKLTHVSKSI